MTDFRQVPHTRWGIVHDIDLHVVQANHVCLIALLAVLKPQEAAVVLCRDVYGLRFLARAAATRII